MKNNVNNEIKKNVIKSIISKYAIYAVQVVTLIIYARIFTPEQFGSVAIVVTIANFFILFGSTSISSAIITKRDLSKSQLDGILTISLFIGILTAIVLGILLYLAGSFFGNDKLYILGWFSYLTVFFSIVNSTANASLIKDYRFKTISFNTILGELLALVVILLLLNSVRGVYLIGARFAIVQASIMIFNYRSSYSTSTGRCILGFDTSGFKIISNFLVNSMGFNILNYFTRNLDNLLVGKFYGFNSLGLYEKAYALMKYPIMLITSAANPAIQPILTKRGYSTESAYAANNMIIRSVSNLGIFFSVFFFFYSSVIVNLLFGEAWLGVAPILSAMSIAIPIQLITSFNGAFWQAADETAKQFKVSVINAIIFIPTVILSVIYVDNLNFFSYIISALLIITCSLSLVVMRNKLFKIRILSTLNIIVKIYIILITIISVSIYLNLIKYAYGVPVLLSTALMVYTLFKRKSF